MERCVCACPCLCMCVHIYIYIYIYMCVCVCFNFTLDITVYWDQKMLPVLYVHKDTIVLKVQDNQQLVLKVHTLTNKETSTALSVLLVMKANSVMDQVCFILYLIWIRQCTIVLLIFSVITQTSVI